MRGDPRPPDRSRLVASDVLDRVVRAAGVAAHGDVLDVGGSFRGAAGCAAERVELLGLGDPEQLPFQGGTFDAVLVDADAAAALPRAHLVEEAARLLRPGGVLALLDVVPTRRGVVVLALGISLARFATDLLPGRIGDRILGGPRACTLDGWRALARARGLALQVEEELPPASALARLDLARDLVLCLRRPLVHDGAVAA